MMTLLTTVERYLRNSAVAPSRFGRQVAGDPRFVFDLRNGREPRAATQARVLAFIAGTQALGSLHLGPPALGSPALGSPVLAPREVA